MKRSGVNRRLGFVLIRERVEEWRRRRAAKKGQKHIHKAVSGLRADAERHRAEDAAREQSRASG
jgi:hypothetical protein